MDVSPHCGSVLIACYDLGLRAEAPEQHSEYYLPAQQRLIDYVASQKPSKDANVSGHKIFRAPPPRPAHSGSLRMLGNKVTLQLIQEQSWHDRQYAEIVELMKELALKNEVLAVTDEGSRYEVKTSRIRCDPPIKGVFVCVLCFINVCGLINSSGHNYFLCFCPQDCLPRRICLKVQDRCIGGKRSLCLM